MKLSHMLIILGLVVSTRATLLEKVHSLREQRSTQKSSMPPITCTDEMNPVCGQDGKMYANVCLMKGAGVAEGAFDTCHCGCPMNHAPVAGEDGEIYMNECYMECAGVQPYQDERFYCAATYEWSPVCGVDGQTYPNPSSMRCAGVEVAFPGNCTCSCHIYGEDWVCGKNELSYFNICQMTCENVELAYNGRCSEDEVVDDE